MLQNIDIDLLHGDALHLHEGLLTHLTETARDLLLRASASPLTASFLDASCESVDTLHICEGLLTHLTETTNLVDILHIFEGLFTHLTETNQVRASTSSTAHGTQNNKEQIEVAAAPVICKEQMKDEETNDTPVKMLCSVFDKLSLQCGKEDDDTICTFCSLSFFLNEEQ